MKKIFRFDDLKFNIKVLSTKQTKVKKNLYLDSDGFEVFLTVKENKNLNQVKLIPRNLENEDETSSVRAKLSFDLMKGDFYVFLPGIQSYLTVFTHSLNLIVTKKSDIDFKEEEDEDLTFKFKPIIEQDDVYRLTTLNYNHLCIDDQFENPEKILLKFCTNLENEVQISLTPLQNQQVSYLNKTTTTSQSSVVSEDVLLKSGASNSLKDIFLPVTILISILLVFGVVTINLITKRNKNVINVDARRRKKVVSLLIPQHSSPKMNKNSSYEECEIKSRSPSLSPSSKESRRSRLCHYESLDIDL